MNSIINRKGENNMANDKEKGKKEAVKHITVKISESIHRKLKVKAAMEDLHMKDLMEKLIIDYTKSTHMSNV